MYVGNNKTIRLRAKRCSCENPNIELLPKKYEVSSRMNGTRYLSQYRCNNCGIEWVSRSNTRLDKNGKSIVHRL